MTTHLPLALVCSFALIVASGATAAATPPDCEFVPAPTGGGDRHDITSTADSGPATLRRAIALAKSGDVINLGALCTNPTPITLNSALPALTRNNVWIGGCGPSQRVVLVNGGGVAANASGLTLRGNRNTLCGLHVSGFPGSGIAIVKGSNNVVSETRTTANDGPGISVAGPSGARNNTLVGNEIGYDALGLLAGNCLAPPPGLACAGIWVKDAQRTVIDANSIVATQGSGILLIGSPGQAEVRDNLIGTSALTGLAGNSGDGINDRTRASVISGNVIVANTGAGIYLLGARASSIEANTIGGSAAGEGNGGNGLTFAGSNNFAFGNTITGNLGYGVQVVAGAMLNTFSQNAISTNQLGAIRLVGLANGGLEPPAITFLDGTDIRGVVLGPVAAPGTVQATHATSGRIELFASLVATDASQWIGDVLVDADQTTWRFVSTVLTAHIPDGAFITATFTPFTVAGDDAATSALSELCDGFDQDADALDADGGVDEDFDADGDGYTTCGVSMSDGTACVDLLHCMDCWDDNDTVVDDYDGDLVFCFQDTCEGDATINCNDADGDGFASNLDVCKNTPCVAGCVVECPVGCVGECPADGTQPSGAYCPAHCSDLSAAPEDLCVPGCGTLKGGDPDDDLATGTCIFPQPERCNGLDDDHDGRFDEPFDGDGDGYVKAPSDPRLLTATCGTTDVHGVAAALDCDDADPLVHPGAVERCGDRIDRDCDGADLVDDPDADGDGVVDDDLDADEDGYFPCVGFGKPFDEDDDDVQVPGALDADGDGATVVDGDCADDDAAMTAARCDGTCPEPQDPAVGCSIDQQIIITVNADGSFTPKWVWIDYGDTVTWVFPAVDTAVSPLVSDSIVPVDQVSGAALCEAYLPWGGDFDFTGPMPRLASGVFAMGVHGRGHVVESYDAADARWEQASGDPACCPTVLGTTADDERLCGVGPANTTMESTWSDPGVTGVFLRLTWDEVEVAPGVFDWTDLDREVRQAVDHGKLFSLVVSVASGGTPKWLFGPDYPTVGAGGLEKLTLQDAYDNDEQCGAVTDFANPFDPGFRTAYQSLLQATAAHLQANNAWYRALTYVKIGGLNTVTDELRMAHTCACGCEVCNTEVWATALRPYSPKALYEFYRDVSADILAAFPDKETAFMLIEDTYPEVKDAGSFKTCIADAAGDEDCNQTEDDTCLADLDLDLGPCPPVTVDTSDIETRVCVDAEVPLDAITQTERVLARGIYEYPYDEYPYDDDDVGGADLDTVCPQAVTRDTYEDGDCALEDVDPACLTALEYWRFVVQHNGLRAKDGGGNPWVLCAGERGQPTAFQTGNQQETVYSPETVQAALDGLWINSRAHLFETYEQRLWQARAEEVELVLDRAEDRVTIITPGTGVVAAQVALHERRVALGAGWLETAGTPVPDPFPATYSHTFEAPDACEDCNVTRVMYYVHGRLCAGGAPPFGVIGIRPEPLEP